MPKFSKSLKVKELAAKYLESGKTDNKKMALLLAQRQKTRENLRVAKKKLQELHLRWLGRLINKAEIDIETMDTAEIFGWFLYFKWARDRPDMADILAACKAKGLEAMGETPESPPAPFWAAVPPKPPKAKKARQNSSERRI